MRHSGYALFGYPKLYGQVPGGQAEYLRVPFGNTLPIVVPERLARARLHGVETLDLREHDNDLAEVIREMTAGRGPDAVIDAVGMEAHGSPGTKMAQQMTGVLPRAVRSQ